MFGNKTFIIIQLEQSDRSIWQRERSNTMNNMNEYKISSNVALLWCVPDIWNVN